MSAWPVGIFDRKRRVGGVKQLPPPPDFAAALISMRDSHVDGSLQIQEVPAPRQLAPWAAAVEVTTVEGSPDYPVGRATLVVLYDPEQVELWGSPLRLVGQARIDVDGDQAGDPLLGEVLWATLADNFSRFGADALGAVGTVTKEISQTFGGLQLRGSELNVELRCSWSPKDLDLSAHLSAWTETLRMNSGVLPQGVTGVSPSFKGQGHFNG